MVRVKGLRFRVTLPMVVPLVNIFLFYNFFKHNLSTKISVGKLLFLIEDNYILSYHAYRAS